MKSLHSFTNLYQVSKTLRFELIPQGKTLENIEKSELIAQDEHRAESYKKVKKIIDEYHKFFITNSLENLRLEGLEDFHFEYQIPKRTEDDKKRFALSQTKLRKQIANSFTSNELYKTLFAKELIKRDLKGFVRTEEELELVKEFDSFTTYFTGFHDNRKNMYSPDDKSTAIGYRLIHQNLPRFIDNMKVYYKIRNTPVYQKFAQLLNDMEEILQVVTIDEMFELEYFNDTLTQRGIDVYNSLIGGYSKPDGEKVQGLNEYINLYNQTASKENRIGKLKPLYKQILSDRQTASYIPEQFKNDQEVLDTMNSFIVELTHYLLDDSEIANHSLVKLLKGLKEFDLNGVFLKNDLSLTEISQKMFGDWGIIQKALDKWYAEKYYEGKLKPESEKYQEEMKKYFRNRDSYSIQFLNECLLLLDQNYHKKIEDYFAGLGDFGDEEKKSGNLFEKYKNLYQSISSLLVEPYDENKDLSQNQKDVEKIKGFLDAIKSIQWFVKPLHGQGDEAEKDDKFYGEFSALCSILDNITPLYNKVRNYMTQKPYSTEKIKLNFENSYFLNGWAQDYETKAGLLFIKDGNYYLGINNKKLSVEEKESIKKNYQLSPAKRIILDFQKPDNKNIPRLFIRSKGENFAPAVNKYNLPINRIIDVYDKGKFKTEFRKVNEEEYEKSLHALIDYFKEGFTKHESYKHYPFSWKETSKYKDIAEFYKDVEVSCYQIFEENINWDILMDFVDKGKLYLFQIYNKDFSPYSKGTPNLHTIYWKMLFDEKNLQNVVYKLNGQAEVFFRKSSIKNENIIVHKANQSIENKNSLNKKAESVFDYDIIKDRRYTMDKFQFHVPITMNFKAEGLNNINQKVNEAIKESEENHVIGIDRGERHLLYLTLIDSKGRIKEQYSLNEIINTYNGETYRTNYHDLLDRKEGDRDEARKNWKTIETIKELKEGYLSQVIHKIAELIVKYNAIVVLEDLNFGFMRGRQKVEKQVYQKFEQMLIDKLNYLVDKKKPINEMGGSLNAYQLTNKFESFQKLGKQSGFLFYIPAWNTSKMDPVTGFVNLFSLKYENMEKAKTFFGKFDSIRYNARNNWFEFSFDYLNFTNKAEGTKTNWVVCTNKTRVETFRNPEKNSSWDNREILLTDEFVHLFDANKIEWKSGECVKENIVNQTDKSFFEKLLHLLKLTLQMRNSITNTEIDYLISPVANEQGEFYDSREELAKGKDSANRWKSVLPVDADANGAYNIARKGLWAIEQIKKAEDLKKVKLAISNKEWLSYVQG